MSVKEMTWERETDLRQLVVKIKMQLLLLSFLLTLRHFDCIVIRAHLVYQLIHVQLVLLD